MKFIQKAKKSLGQNFLIDKNIINKIIEIGNINNKKIVLEIGPGHGNLTDAIINKKPKEIYAVEKDKQLSLNLQKKYKNYKNFKVINRDILDIIEEKRFHQKMIIFGNLPYNISTKILASLILLKDWPPWYEVLIFMFQKEVADRILANKQTKDFSRLTILSNWRLEIKKHFNVSRHCFFPKPKVDSSLLSFRPKINNSFNLKNPKNLEKVARVLFSNRRKMINKNFNKLFGAKKNMIENVNVDLNKRPGELSNEIFYKIALEYERLCD